MIQTFFQTPIKVLNRTLQNQSQGHQNRKEVKKVQDLHRNHHQGGGKEDLAHQTLLVLIEVVALGEDILVRAHTQVMGWDSVKFCLFCLD